MNIFDSHKLRELRIKYGMTQEELAYRSNSTKNFIGNIERGKCNMTLSYLCKLASVFDVDPGALLISKTDKTSGVYLNEEILDDDYKNLCTQILYIIETFSLRDLRKLYKVVKGMFDLSINKKL